MKLGLTKVVITTMFKDIRRGIKTDIKQPKPVFGVEEEAYLALLRTAEELQHHAAERLKPHGLSPTQYNALRVLRGAGEGGLACGDIGKRMISRDPDITRLLDRLVRRGFVARRRHHRDRRVITARITPAGLQILRRLDEVMNDFPRRLLGHLGETQLRSLITALQTVRERLRGRRELEALDS